ncbi:MAG: response regulator [Chloroflexi bacterium]|nr:response regulator [Chloroflexota bacterium]
MSMIYRAAENTQSTFTTAVGTQPQSILVVDDEPSFSAVLSEILRSFGYLVLQANSVEHAIAILEEDIPDLILTDIMMPGIDGLSFVRRIQSEPLLSSIPTIIVSAKHQPADIEAGVMAGADVYLIKPFSANELREAVQSLLE